MKTRFTPHLVDLTFDAALKSFWRKDALATFLRNSDVQGLPNWAPDESKRGYLQRVFDALQKTDRGKAQIVQLARFLSEQTAFPDLQGWEDTSQKLDAAKRSVGALKNFMREQDDGMAADLRRQRSREQQRSAIDRAQLSQQTLQSLSDTLAQLSRELGAASAGLGFESWFYSLMQFSEISCRTPYVANGRQIDGSITIGDTTYLVECKFTTEQSGAQDVDIFRAKVESKADNTMGLFVSISGYSSVAINEASGRKTPLLLLDHSHLYAVLGGTASFRDVVERVRRHCSQTGEAYLPYGKFDG